MIAPKVWFISCFLYKIPICLRNPQNQNYWIFLDIPQNWMWSNQHENPSIGSPTVCRIPRHPRHLIWLTSFNVAHLQPVIDSYRLFLPSKKEMKPQRKRCSVHLLCSLTSHQQILGVKTLQKHITSIEPLLAEELTQNCNSAD